MVSNGNTINDGPSFQPSAPKLCANGCGFFGTAATINFCSKCYRDLRIKDDDFMAKSRTGCSPLALGAGETVSKRCSSCEKKLGLLGFRCRCGATLCGTHSCPEKHECKFEFMGLVRDAIARDNPVGKADKVVRF